MFALPALLMAPAPAHARACGDMTAVVAVAGPSTDVLVSLPTALVGREVAHTDVTVTQDGSALPITSFTRGDPAAIDVVVVVDATGPSAAALTPVRTAASALVAALPSEARTAVLTAGGTPPLSQGLSRGRDDVVSTLATLTPGAGRSLVDALGQAVRQLPAAPGRQQHVVVVAAGPATATGSALSAATSVAEKRGISIDVLDLAAPALPALGAQCPAAGTAPDVAGGELARYIADRRRMVMPALEGSAPVTVQVETAGTSASAVLDQRDQVAANGVGRERPARDGAVGIGTLLLALLVGLTGFSLLLLLIVVGTHRGRRLLAALRATWAAGLAAVRERQTRDAATKAEARRRFADAMQDLRAALADEPTAVELALQAARLEDAIWEDARARARTRDARLRAREKAAARVAASLRQAQRRAAEERAARESLDRIRGDIGALPEADAAGLAAAMEAATDRLLAAQRAAADAEEQAGSELVAAERAEAVRVAAELAARHATDRASKEIAAAEKAVAERAAAERAAAEAIAAEREAQAAEASVAEALGVMRAALAAERAAAEALKVERAAAEALAAEQAAAEREAVQQAVARRAAAEKAAAEAVAAAERAAEQERESVAGAARALAERAAVTAADSSPAVPDRDGADLVVAAAPAGRAGDDEQDGAGIDLREGDGRSRPARQAASVNLRLVEDPSTEGPEPGPPQQMRPRTTGPLPAPTGRGKKQRKKQPKGSVAVGHAEPRQLVTSRVPASAPVITVTVDAPPLVPAWPASWHMAHGAPLVRTTATAQQRSLDTARTRARLLELREDDARSVRQVARQGRVARAVLLAMLPAAAAWRSLSSPGWLTAALDGSAGRAGLLLALTLGLVGSGWVWRVTRPPFALLRRPSAKGDSHVLRSMYAAEQLALRLAAGAAPSQAWTPVAIGNHFGVGSAVPAATVGAAVAIVRRSRRTVLRTRLGRANHRAAVAAVPVVVCLLPAVLLLAVL